MLKESYLEKLQNDIFLNEDLRGKITTIVNEEENWKERVNVFGNKNKLKGEPFTDAEGLIFGHFLSENTLNHLLSKISHTIEEQEIQADRFLTLDDVKQKQYLASMEYPVIWIFLDDNANSCPIDDENHENAPVILKELVSRLALKSSDKNLFFCFKKEHNIYRPTILDAGNNAYKNWQPGGRTSTNDKTGLCEFVINRINTKNIIGRIKKYDF